MTKSTELITNGADMTSPDYFLIGNFDADEGIAFVEHCCQESLRIAWSYTTPEV